MISSTNQAFSREASVRNLSSRLRPAPVGKVWPRSPHQQLDHVGEDAIERHGQGDDQAGAGEVHRVLVDQEHDHNGGQGDKGDTCPQEVGGNIGISHWISVQP